MTQKKKRLTKAGVAVLIQRRIRISERAIGVIARDKRNDRLIDYHQGCIGVCYCLLDDLEVERLTR